MARIPVAPTGQVIAQPTPAFHVDLSGAQRNAAELEHVGAMGMGVADQMHDQQVQEARRQERVRQAAEDAENQATITAARDALADAQDSLSNDVLTGAVAKDEAEKVWGERAQAIGEEALPKIKGTQAQAIARNDVTALTNRLGNRVRRTVEHRNRQDVTAATEQTLEYLARQYQNDPAGTTQMAMATVDQLAPFSDQAPDYWQRKKQAWRESTQYTAAFEVVNAAKGDAKLLNAAERMLTGEKFADLDPQKRAVLGNQIDAARVNLAQKAEIAAARAARAAEHQLNVARAEFETAQALADKGVFSPAYFERANKATAGTPYNAGLKALLQQTQENGALATQPLAIQRQTLDSLQQRGVTEGQSPDLAKRTAQVQRIVSQSETDYKNDAMRAGNERGVIQLQPLNMGGGVAGLLPQLGARVRQSQIVSQVTGRAESPLTNDEAALVHQALQTLPARERAQSVAMLANALGPAAAQGLSRQMDDKDRALSLAFSAGASMTTNGRLTSELILKGAQAQKDGTSTKGQRAPEVVAGRWKSVVSDAIGDAFGSQATTDQVRDAAVYVAHAIASEKGGDLSEKDLKRAVTLAVGGPVIEHNGRKLPLPAGIDEDGLTERLRSVKPAEIVRQLPHIPPAATVSLTQKEESEFQKWARALPWFSEFKNRYGAEPNLNDPDYNYRAAWKAGIAPERYAPDGNAYHWPSALQSGEMLKSDHHPTAWMEYTVVAGGVQVPLDEFIKSLPGQQLIPVRNGEYAVLVKGRPVLNVRGEKIIIQVR